MFEQEVDVIAIAIISEWAKKGLHWVSMATNGSNLFLLLSVPPLLIESVLFSTVQS